MISDSLAQWIGNLFLLATFGAAIWYAWEARRLRLQMVRPKVIFFFVAPEEHLAVKNVGEGVAINVHFGPVSPASEQLEVEPSSMPILEKGDTKRLILRKARGSYKPDMATILADGRISLAITSRYSDVDGRSFETTTSLGGAARPPFIRDG